MDIEIKATEEEKRLVVEALIRLNGIRHLNYMSQATIAMETDIKPSKIRVILADLMTEGSIIQYVVDDNRIVKRYYYTVEQAGREKYLSQ